jgi:hypothetical protein
VKSAGALTSWGKIEIATGYVLGCRWSEEERVEDSRKKAISRRYFWVSHDLHCCTV